MVYLRIARIASVALVGACSLLACSNDETTTEPSGPVSYAAVTPGGSFRDDVMPLLSRACALSASCHQGDPGEGIEGLGFGPSTTQGVATEAQLDAIHDQLLNLAPNRSSFPFVKAGDPSGSWLMAKIEYDTAELEQYGGCSEDCGVFMPQGSTPDKGFTRAERDTIAAWILDGAQNN